MPGLVLSAARDLPHAILVLTPRGKNSDTHFTDEETGAYAFVLVQGRAGNETGSIQLYRGAVSQVGSCAVFTPAAVFL